MIHQIKKIILSVFSLIIFLISCQQENKNQYLPSEYMSQIEQDSLMLKIIPYFGKLPKGVSYKRRFDSTFVPYYKKNIQHFSFQHYYISPEDSFHYFMVNRSAPSLYEKKLAIAGKFKLDSEGNIHDYEEIFWTFKMFPDTLSRKGRILFEEMVQHGQLDEYLPGKKPDEWVEFPDEHCYYDKKQQRWRFTWEQDSSAHAGSNKEE